MEPTTLGVTRDPQGRGSRAGPQLSTPFRILPSPKDSVSLKNTHGFLSAIGKNIPEMISLTYAADGSIPEIYFIAACPEKSSVPLFEQLIHTYYPNTILEPFNMAEEIYCPPGAWEDSLVYAASDSHKRLIKVFGSLQPDPLAQLFRLFESLQPDERIIFSVSVMLYPDEPKTLYSPYPEGYPTPSWWNPETASLFYVPISVRFVAGSKERLVHLVRAVDRFFQIYTHTAPHDEDCFFQRFQEPDKLEQHHTSWLTVHELAGLVHFPHSSIQSPIFRQADKLPKPPPPDFLTNSAGLIFGTSEHRRKELDITLPHELRSRHVYLGGASGQGKSTLIANLIVQDLESDSGFTLLDPHGDLAERILSLIPHDRMEDVIYFDPADKDYIIPLDILNAQPGEEELVADALVVTFRRLIQSWGDRMEHILRNTVYTLLATGGQTFADIRKILVNPDYRNQVVKGLTNPMLQDFWFVEFPQLPRDATQPIINKFSKFLNPFSTSQYVFSVPSTKLNFSEIMQGKKIFLANLSEGKLGLETSHLIGAFLVSQLQLAAMRRATISVEERRPFTLYVDEFQNFTAGASAFEKMLSEARKYNLQLVLSNQYIAQLSKQVTDAIFGNVHTIVSFRLGVDDARYIQKTLPAFTPEDLQNLNIGQAIMRCGKAEDSFRLSTFPPPELPSTNFSEEIIDHSRKTYGIPITQLTEKMKQKIQQESEPKKEGEEEDFWG